ncbi:hypothetical protein MPSEU_000559200 [Mayamaea pseudoterrestris]|nr:hypothetical protein MPSEU_000559200 [Mayamaea pseudoterrestris]
MKHALCLLPLLALCCQAWVFWNGQRTSEKLFSIRLRSTKAPSDSLSIRAAALTLNEAAAIPNTVHCITGYVTAIRGFGKSFCFVDISTKDAIQQVMLKRQEYQNSHFDATRRAMLPGVKLRVTGVMIKSKNQEDDLLVHNATIVGWPRNPQHVRILLELLEQGELSSELSLPPSPPPLLRNSDVGNALQFNNSAASTLYLRAKQIVESLPSDDDYPYEILSTLNAGDFLLPKAPIHIQRGPSNELSQSADSLISMSAIVMSRRRYQGNITQLELVDESTQERFLGILHSQCFLSFAFINVFSTILAPTSRVQVSGFMRRGDCDEQGLFLLWVTDCRIVQASWQPKTIEYLLEVTRTGDFDRKDAATALNISASNLAAIVNLSTTTERQWKAAELSRNMQALAHRYEDASHGKSVVANVLEHFRTAREQFPFEAVNDIDTINRNRSNVDYSNDGSRWRRKKEPQLAWMLQQVEQIVQHHPDYELRPIRILDIGGGKGLLANYLASHMLGKVEVQVIDISDRAVKNGAMRSKRLSLPVKYTVGDASQARLITPVDVVVALHACGTLTDVALGHAVLHNASFVICPCCFCSHPHLRVPTRGQSVDKHASLTASDWLDVDAIKLGELQRIAEIQGDMQTANQAIHSICALRACAAENRCQSLKVSIKTFPLAFSTRNFCLIGSQF